MAKHKVITTDAKINRALERAKTLRESRVLNATYNPELNLLLLQLSDGHRRVIPAEDVEGLQTATVAQRSAIEILGKGTGLHWPKLNLDLYVPTLLQGITGTKRWLAEMGRKGGSAKTPKKRKASQRNGRFGGRPKKLAVSAPDEAVSPAQGRAAARQKLRQAASASAATAD
jgi:hypothetical protein